MAGHQCPRCGLEFERDTWRDRHPAAAVCAGVFVGLPALYTVAGVILAYPWFFVPVLVVVCALLVNRAQRRRAAIAARADWEYRQQMLGAVFADHRALAMQPPPRRRAAGHSAVTERILRRG
ncbi:hypothetical protein O972_25300 [Mycobacterium avium subsp. avium 10-9275]|nr:hypothetical protein BBJ32_16435 [Mycobacterium avium]AYJ05175.1 hypothetical protein DBO90_10455 [Mycobacterium avium]ETB09704.1 hypothetical protein O972_25300 [Mycobacterium avium subsp. avium 10-9275]ETB12478.1 hypothetical protein P863_06700 [Mycobacterium avium subsp. silvaticum ATCC 49884]ETB23024.1 hypothetical protein O973_05595 [Mycobacterium avium subsp. avium 11-4751]